MNDVGSAPVAVEPEPLALIRGEPYLKLPRDLYIPPDALEIFLEAFEGPLDLLLYLIKRHNIDIVDIPIAEVTRQYMDYLVLMQRLHLELAAEYLVMAATLAEIKSRLLLPRPGETEEDDQDPRAELVRRLQEYERFKRAAEDLDQLPRLERDLFPVSAEPMQRNQQRPLPTIPLHDLLLALKEVLQRADRYEHHQVQREPLSVRERMSRILGGLEELGDRFADFGRFFSAEEGRLGVVVTLLALLELIRERLIELIQNEPFAPIYVRRKPSP